MDLKEFVSETIKQVVDGIVEAQLYAEEKKAKVVPFIYKEVLEDIHTIDFDVAVTASKGSASKGGAGLFVGPVALGAKGESNTSDSSISRIKFKVPLELPSHELTNEKKG